MLEVSVCLSVAEDHSVCDSPAVSADGQHDDSEFVVAPTDSCCQAGVRSSPVRRRRRGLAVRRRRWHGRCAAVGRGRAGGPEWWRK